MKKLILFVFLCIALVSAQEVPHTVEIITARDGAVFPISFFNSGQAGTYSAALEGNSPAVRVDVPSINVASEEFGSFNLIIGNEEISRGVYFDKLVISNGFEIVQEIPIVVGLESKISEIKYDVSIDFDSSSDISIISGETVLSPDINIYKLDYNSPGSNAVAIAFSVYSLDGELLSHSEEVVSVSRQASFEHFFNLGLNEYGEVLIVVSAKRENSYGLDMYQISLSNNILFSPAEESNFSSNLYIGIFIFLISSIMLISYLWYNRSINQANNWKSELEYVKKTQFSDAAKSIRKLEAQKDVLNRAYSSKYISKSSFDSAISEINTLMGQLKKRL